MKETDYKLVFEILPKILIAQVAFNKNMSKDELKQTAQVLINLERLKTKIKVKQ